MSDEFCDCKDNVCGCGCDCACECCGNSHRFHRRYQTKAEQIAELETYLSDLKAEVQAVEEQLEDLKK
jgi:hypothetical protein